MVSLRLQAASDEDLLDRLGALDLTAEDEGIAMISTQPEPVEIPPELAATSLPVRSTPAEDEPADLDDIGDTPDDIE